MDDLISIGEFSARSGLSPKRLRSYAAAGLLPPAAIESASGYRFYDPGQVRVAELIDALRGAGMPVAAIGEFLRCPTADRLGTWATRLEYDAVQRSNALDLARRLLVTPGEPDARTEAIMRLDTASRTETGPVRPTNEDAVLTGPALAAVADGLGGGPGGQLASALAVAILSDAFTGRSADELTAAVRAANRAIFERADGADGLDGMGTTICAAGLTGDGGLTVVHVGDSRTYLCRDGALTRLTDDHSVPWDLLRRGELTEAEFLTHPQRNVLTRALGAGPAVEPDSATHQVVPGDRLLLCTDGLFTEAAADDIAAAMTSGAELQETADELVELALAGGGRDNVSVVVAEVR